MRSLTFLGLLTALGLLSVSATAQAQVYTATAPQGVPTLPGPVLLPVRPLTVQEFASAVKPLPGKYEVLLVHPKTGCPVKVCFTLPPGCIRKVRVNSHRIEFVYKCQRDVVIRFLHGGGVWVRG